MQCVEIEYGFIEFIARYDFSSDPIPGLLYKTKDLAKRLGISLTVNDPPL